MSLNDSFAVQVLKRAEEETHGWKMMIGGKWVASRSGNRMTSVNPAYDEVIAEVPRATAKRFSSRWTPERRLSSHGAACMSTSAQAIAGDLPMRCAGWPARWECWTRSSSGR